MTLVLLMMSMDWKEEKCSRSNSWNERKNTRYVYKKTGRLFW